MPDKRFGHKVQWVTVKCAACGKLMERRATDMARKKTGRVFCSKACQHRVGAKPRRKQEVTCPVCGKVFYPRSGGANIYCSIACHNIGQTKRGQRTCEICGKAFEVRPSQIHDKIVKMQGRQYIAHAKRFCSQECAGRALWQRPQEHIHNGKPVLLTPTGYVKVWEPNRPPRRRWVLEHRLVMEKQLGRPLGADEHVHHLNGDKTDNRPANLLIIANGEHATMTNANTWEQIERDREELERYRRLYGPLPAEGQGSNA